MNIFTKIIQGFRGTIDILTTPTYLGVKRVRKNNYIDYDSQVKAINDKYNSIADYGCAMVRTIIDTRAAFIAGEGLSLVATNSKKGERKKTQEWLDRVTQKELDDIRVIEMVQEGEKEGKQLVLFKKNNESQEYELRILSYNNQHYTIETDPNDYKKIKRVYYTQGSKQIDIPLDKAVYVKLGGSESNINKTPPRIANVLTEIDNYDRAKFDLRETNHLWGRITPYFKTQNMTEANQINSAINGKKNKWEVGQAVATSAEFSLIGPPIGAAETLIKEMSVNLKQISTISGMPVHRLGWTDLMSNRATADELKDMIDDATKKERLIWKQKFKEIIQKKMQLEFEAGYEGSINDYEGFEVELPFISEYKLKEILEIWLSLYQSDVISMSTLRNKTPAIDPEQEKKLIESEKEENMQRANDFMNNRNNMIEDDDEDT